MSAAATRMRRGYADTPAGQVHYRELGEGRPLLLLHKTPASSTMYGRVMPLFAEGGYRAIAIDTPGYGSSDAPPEPPRAIAYYAGAALGVLDALEVPRASVLGFYTGSSVALELAVSQPERVDALVLAGIAAFADEDERAEFRRAIARAGQMRDHLDLDVDGAFVDRYPLGWFRDYPRADGEHFLVHTIAYLQAATRYSWAYESVVAYDAYAVLPRVSQPTLFLAPVDGQPNVTESTRRAAALVPGAALVELAGTSEVAMAAPAAFAAPVLEFLASVHA